MFTDGLAPVIRLYKELIDKFNSGKTTKGRPQKYSQLSFLLFFMTMFIKKIHKFKAMARYTKDHYEIFNFPSAPSRQTIRRRFLDLPVFIKDFLPFTAENLEVIDERFTDKVAYVDKTLFPAKGGILHKSQKEQGYIPNKRIDIEASWGYSPYKKWIYGFAVHLVSNVFRFPLSATVTEGNLKEYKQVSTLIESLKNLVLLVGDKAYRVIPVIKEAFERFGVFLITTGEYKDKKDQFKKEYSYIISLDYAKELFYKRKSSIEPVFSLIKELFSLNNMEPLPYKTLQKNQSFLFVLVFTVQFMFVFNSLNGKNLGSISSFKGVFL